MPSDVRQILMLKCTKFDFRWGSAPEPLAGFKAPTSKGRESKMEGRGRVESGGKNEGHTTTKGERRKWIGGREGKRKGFAGPMSNCFLGPCLARSTMSPTCLAADLSVLLALTVSQCRRSSWQPSPTNRACQTMWLQTKTHLLTKSFLSNYSLDWTPPNLSQIYYLSNFRNPELIDWLID